MRKMYQQEWFGIEFSSFTVPSARTLASADFYEKFYQAFFQRYASWRNLDHHWLEQKKRIARFILDQVGSESAILSIGCGLGCVEHYILEMSGPKIRLEAQEVAPTSLRWIKAEVPPERLHLGSFPQCLPPECKYDLIFMSAMDYCLDQPSLLGLLQQVRQRLLSGGRCMLVSASFRPAEPLIQRTVAMAKQVVAELAVRLGLLQRGQFWGWSRNAEEYHKVFLNAGLVKLQDGFIQMEKGLPIYWLSGQHP